MAIPERRTVDILLTTALLTAAGVAVYCTRRVILGFYFRDTLHLRDRSRSEVSAAPFLIFSKSQRAGRRRGVTRVCAADSARGLHVCAKLDETYDRGIG
jgi:hypothetical protein